ncbi:MAG: cysteine hydrolase family protein [Dethiobacteria bacterium]|jgi:nicotinamidase/pyrazinamidase|nr:cysteine hydrolase [Bacillota bacterium]
MSRALLVIDMLVDFLEQEGVLYLGDVAEEVTAKVKAEIEAARQRGEKVIYVCDRHQKDDAEFKMFPPHCLQGERGSEIIATLQPLDGERVIPKRRYSAFFATELDLVLREAGVTALTLVGVCTNICVLYTAADARALNYEVRVIKDAVASFDRSAHEFALKEMEKTLGVELV